jgi:hypothetical protein
MKSKIIAISGKIGSGKDEFAKILAELSNIPIERHAFADKVRDVTELIVGQKMSLVFKPGEPFYNPVFNYTQDEKNIFLPMWNKTIGECLQLIGTDVFRNNFDKNTWIKSLFSTTGKNCLENNRLLVIPDCRFPNEADSVVEQGGIVIRMEGDPKSIRANSTRNLNHESETALDNYSNFTKIIYNDIPDINVLKTIVKDVLNQHVYQE